MRLTTTYIALFAILMHLFFTSGYLLDYYVNSDFYKEKCENRSRPKLSCNGKCLLAKKLARVSGDSTQDSMAAIPSMSNEYLCSDLIIDDPDQVVILYLTYREYPDLYTYSYSFSLLKPPIG